MRLSLGYAARIYYTMMADWTFQTPKVFVYIGCIHNSASLLEFAQFGFNGFLLRPLRGAQVLLCVNVEYATCAKRVAQNYANKARAFPKASAIYDAALTTQFETK